MIVQYGWHAALCWKTTSVWTHPNWVYCNWPDDWCSIARLEYTVNHTGPSSVFMSVHLVKIQTAVSKVCLHCCVNPYSYTWFSSTSSTMYTEIPQISAYLHFAPVLTECWILKVCQRDVLYWSVPFVIALNQWLAYYKLALHPLQVSLQFPSLSSSAALFNGPCSVLPEWPAAPLPAFCPVLPTWSAAWLSVPCVICCCTACHLCDTTCHTHKLPIPLVAPEPQVGYPRPKWLIFKLETFSLKLDISVCCALNRVSAGGSQGF